MKTTSKRQAIRYRLMATIEPSVVAAGRDAVAATFKALLEAWSGSPDRQATVGDTWSSLLAGRPFRWPWLPKATVDNVRRLLEGVPGLAVEVERRG